MAELSPEAEVVETAIAAYNATPGSETAQSLGEAIEAPQRSRAYYLLRAKQWAQPADPVARFHLRNGARVERINWGADRSDKGRAESYGMLVNYVYDPGHLANNHIAYVNDFVVAHSPAVAELLK